MIHIRAIAKRPACAQQQRTTIGEVLTVVVEMLTVLTIALEGKDSSSSSSTSESS